MGLLRPHRAKLALAALLAVVAGGGWLWLRDSSLVAVRNIRVTGLSGSAAPTIRSSLEQAARSMTTLHVQVGKLRAAVASYTVVKDLQVSSQFPHGLRIHVVEQLPVAALDVGGGRIAVAGNGTVVRGMPAPASVPTLPLASLPNANRVTDRTTLLELTVLDAAPPQLRTHVARIGYGPRGLTIWLRNGPQLFFSDTSLLHAKWDAAVRVLAEPSAHGASYIDVRIPGQPTAQVGDPATSGATAQAPGIVPIAPPAAVAGQGASGAGAGAATTSGAPASGAGAAVPPGG
jgi:cell division protein FtsQ